MSGRSFVKQIRSSETFGSLTYRQRDLFHGLVEVADDQGRLVGNPASVRAEVWRYDEEITVKEVQEELDVLAGGTDPFIKIYQVNGKTYIQIINWWKYQRMDWAAKSAFPAPDGWTDRVKINEKGGKTLMQHWYETGGFNSVPTKKTGEKLSDVDTEIDTEVGIQIDTTIPIGINKLKEIKQKEVKPNQIKPTAMQSQIPTCSSGPSEAVKSAWSMALGELRAEMSKADFETWVKPAQLSGLSGKVISVSAQNSYGVTWLNKRVRSTLEKKLRTILQDDAIELEFVLAHPEYGKTKPAAVPVGS